MQESPYYDVVLQRGIERGIAQGARDIAIKNIISVLTVRFQDTDIQTATDALEAIDDIERLTQLHNTALSTPTFNAFLQALDR